MRARLLPEHDRRTLAEAIFKLNRMREGERDALYPHEADALWAEIERLANCATLLGEASPAERAGLGPFRSAVDERLARADAVLSGGPGSRDTDISRDEKIDDSQR